MVEKICRILSTALLTVLLLLAIALAAPPLLGYQVLAVISGSMEPAIPVGSVVYVGKTTPESISLGDVITFTVSADGTVATHRVVENNSGEKYFITKGDANNVNDGEIAYDRLVGKVSASVPYMGYLTAMIKSPKGILIGAGVLILLILVNTLPQIFKKEEPKDSASEAEQSDPPK